MLHMTENIIGRVYGRLTVIGRAQCGLLHCSCECGGTKTVRLKALVAGHTKSCGCLQRQRSRENIAAGHAASRTHGLSRTFEWNAWMRMRSRTRNSTTKNSERYIGRGISVHPEWDESFEAFLRDVGPAPSRKHSIDRIDNDGHYVPGNVRWATSRTQNRNKSDNVIVEFHGHRMTLVEAVEGLDISYTTAWHRIQRAGWSVERALTQPVRR